MISASFPHGMMRWSGVVELFLTSLCQPVCILYSYYLYNYYILCHLGEQEFFCGILERKEILVKDWVTFDSTYYSNLLISCSILLNQAINLQVKSSPSWKKQDPFLERKKEKVSRFLKARKWSPYSRQSIWFQAAPVNKLVPYSFTFEWRFRILEIAIRKPEQEWELRNGT